MARLHAVWMLAFLIASAPVAQPVRAETRQAAAPRPSDVLRAGDRVALIGDAFFEREYRFGLIETALTLAHREKALTFRSLGWSGDTVWGEARAYRGEPKEGYAELMKNLDELAVPTVIFVAYGANESFAGEEGLVGFLEQYRILLDDLSRRSPRIVLLTPLPHDASSSPLPAPAIEARNRALARYAQAIRDLARTRGLAAIDLFTLPVPAGRPPQPLFHKGVHLTEAGYTIVAEHIASQTLPDVQVETFSRAWRGSSSGPGAPADPSAQAWSRLRDLVVDKNDAFFHRWRPANAAYIYLSRRGGQGTTAQEIPRFDPVVGEKEQGIARALAALPSARGSSERSR